jgi:hypothetical protein
VLCCCRPCCIPHTPHQHSLPRCHAAASLLAALPLQCPGATYSSGTGMWLTHYLV